MAQITTSLANMLLHHTDTDSRSLSAIDISGCDLPIHIPYNCAFVDQRQYLGGVPLGFRASTGLPRKRAAPNASTDRGETGPKLLAQHIALTLLDAGKHRRDRS